ncbi:30S ribosomal protein bS22 [Jidongwangia harbinensis]|uniref:30S ribosomal protein bS22 n=1 Tax=Jidongwangia harbinensis TaxID=2878561 RepID=UPI003FD7A08D
MVPGLCALSRRIRAAVQIGCGPPRVRARIDPAWFSRGFRMGSVVKKRRKRMAKKKHRKLLRKTRVQRRRLGK